jgi:hypothetical protein
MFTHFKNIEVGDKSTWSGRKLLTFDIDWACDEVLHYLLDILEAEQVRATMFVTHATPVLERMRNNPLIELGIHPNFNPLIEGADDAKSAQATLAELKELVPEAAVCRSHSLTTSGRWLGMYQAHKIEVLSNTMMNSVQYIEPYHQVNGLTEVPIFFADDGHIYISDEKHLPLLDMDSIVERAHEGLRVFNFHPIHIAINTDSFEFYNNTRSIHQDMAAIESRRNQGEGACTILKKLIQTNNQ